MQYFCDWIDVSTLRIFREYRENLNFPPVILAGNNLENPSECDVFLIFVFLIFSDTEYTCYIFFISVVMLARGCNAGAAFHSNGRFDVHVCPTPQIPRKHIHSLSILSPEKYLLKKMKQNIKKHKETLNEKNEEHRKHVENISWNKRSCGSFRKEVLPASKETKSNVASDALVAQ